MMTMMMMMQFRGILFDRPDDWETKKQHDIFLLSTVLSSIELRGNDEHVTTAKD